MTFTGTCTYVVGQGAVTVVDPGPLDETHLQTLMAALKDERVATILVTHTHRDHSPLAARLKDLTGAPILGAAPHFTARDLVEGEYVRLDAGADYDYAPDRVMADGDVHHGDGYTLTAIETPGHTANHLAFALHEDKALLSGDHVMGWSTAVISPPDGNMGDYFASLRKLLPRDETLYIPTHGAEIRNPGPFVQAYIEQRLGREAQSMARLKEGPQTVPQMVAKNYADTPLHLHAAAGRSMLAHLVQMVKDGRVKTEDGRAAIDSIYRL